MGGWGVCEYLYDFSLVSHVNNILQVLVATLIKLLVIPK